MTGGNPEPLDPTSVDQRRCETSRGYQLDPDDLLAAALVGQVRRVMLDRAGVVIDLSGDGHGCSPAGPVMRCCSGIDGVSGPDAIFVPGAAKPTTPNPGQLPGRHDPPTAAQPAPATTVGNTNTVTAPGATPMATGTPTDPTEPNSATPTRLREATQHDPPQPARAAGHQRRARHAPTTLDSSSGARRFGKHGDDRAIHEHATSFEWVSSARRTMRYWVAIGLGIVATVCCSPTVRDAKLISRRTRGPPPSSPLGPMA